MATRCNAGGKLLQGVGWVVCVAVAAQLAAPQRAAGQQASRDTSRGDALLARYFDYETQRIEREAWQGIETREDWEQRREGYRQQLLEMLGLVPWPSKTDLQAEVTAITDHGDFRVERLQFQSRPGLYVTGNLYVPGKDQGAGPFPAILYVCGHGGVKREGVSYGNKVTYQHHGAWFARHGYVCLTIDTLQLGEIEGIHHGTYRYGKWWWLSRGYTPAGVEAWNCVRALDYLCSRGEVDANRLGVTGRSGGGAYSWWIAAIDERIKAAVPVAGITDLRNHVVDGCVEGHCDCMYMVNTYRWDYAQVAALVAPRPLLISNTDRDRIFPLDGVVRTYNQVARIYDLYGARENVALQITAGPHKDTQELRVHAFRWFNHHLKGSDELVASPAVKYFEPAELKVFATLPEDQLNSQISETFTPPAVGLQPPRDRDHWEQLRADWMRQLNTKSFRGWPREAGPAQAELAYDRTAGPVRLQAYDLTTQRHVRLRYYVVQRADSPAPKRLELRVMGPEQWQAFVAAAAEHFETPLGGEWDGGAAASWKLSEVVEAQPQRAVVFVALRGIGATAWDQSERKQTQHQRRFYLLGQTLDGMRVWDLRRVIQGLRSTPRLAAGALQVEAQGTLAGVALYAALYEDGIDRLVLDRLPATHRLGPHLLNVSRILDLPQTVTLAAARTKVELRHADPQAWEYVRQSAKAVPGASEVVLQGP